MKLLHLPPTEKTPEVILDDELSLFQVKGLCLPENVRDFSQTVIEKLEYYMQILDRTQESDLKKKPFRVNFKLGYFNTAAAKFIADVLMHIKAHMQAGSHIKIFWHYNEDDYDMLEAGEDIAKMVDVPVTFVMVVRMEDGYDQSGKSMH
ncbi:MAG: hypothetical protein A2Y87_06555 [Bacteroidetes bacterium RBG_13_46_8]|nr:MAG: hypothetical protein A2Y87_06555 [Bacteroidetes bacterium RBG_13_46_8]